MGYDPYPVVRERLPDPSSGTAPDTTFESENRISSQECSGNSWKRGSEPVIRSRFGNASEFPRIRPDPGRIFRLGYWFTICICRWNRIFCHFSVSIITESNKVFIHILSSFHVMPFYDDIIL